MANNNEEIKASKGGLVAHIIVSILFLVVGICLLTMDVSIISQIAYSFSVLVVGILFICFGAYYMIRYFFNHEYTRLTNYGFTMGVILVIIGAVFIFQAGIISSFIDALVYLIGFVLGAVMLQESFALFHIQRGTWFFSLLFGLLTIAASVYFLLVPDKVFEGGLLSCIYLIAVGGLSLFSLLLMVIGLRDHKNDSSRIYKRNMEEAPVSSKKTEEESIFEEEPVVETIDATADDDNSDTLFED